jgi:hypothetical protein
VYLLRLVAQYGYALQDDNGKAQRGPSPVLSFDKGLEASGLRVTTF